MRNVALQCPKSPDSAARHEKSGRIPSRTSSESDMMNVIFDSVLGIEAKSGKTAITCRTHPGLRGQGAGVVRPLVTAKSTRVVAGPTSLLCLHPQGDYTH